MRPPLREAAGIKGDHPIGFPQLLDDLSDQYLDQWTMIPGRGPNELLQDQALDIDEGRNLLGILAVQVGQQTRQVEGHITLPCRGLQTVLIGHHEVAQTVHQGVEHVRGNDAIVQQLLVTLGSN